MEEKQEKPLPPIAVIACAEADRIHAMRSELRRKLKTCFAAARLTHLHRGASEKEIGVYDYISGKIIDTVIEGNVTLVAEVVFRLDSGSEPGVIPPEHMETITSLLRKVAAMLASDGFESGYALDTYDSIMTEGKDGKLIVTHVERDIAEFEVHLRPDLKFRVRAIEETEDVIVPTPSAQTTQPTEP